MTWDSGVFEAAARAACCGGKGALTRASGVPIFSGAERRVQMMVCFTKERPSEARTKGFSGGGAGGMADCGVLTQAEKRCGVPFSTRFPYSGNEWAANFDESDRRGS